MLMLCNGCMQIREYHRRHPAARYVDTTDEYEQLLKEEPVIEFTGEVDSVFHTHKIQTYA